MQTATQNQQQQQQQQQNQKQEQEQEQEQEPPAFSPMLASLLASISLNKALTFAQSSERPSLPSLILAPQSALDAGNASGAGTANTVVPEWRSIGSVRLYLGAAEHALDPRTLVELGISHIANLSGAINVFEHGVAAGIARFHLDPERVRGWLALDPLLPPPAYWAASVADTPMQNIARYFPSAFRFLDAAVQSAPQLQPQPSGELQVRPVNILVHCQAGISRSSTLVIAFLMHSLRMTLDEAWLYVKARRPIVSPNIGFANQLLLFHAELFPDNPSGADVFRRVYSLVK